MFNRPRQNIQSLHGCDPEHIHFVQSCLWELCVCEGGAVLRVFEHVNLGKDLERRAQFDVHSSHEVVLLQQQQGLSIDLLRAELLCNLQTTCGHTPPTGSVSTQKQLCEENHKCCEAAPTWQCGDELVDVLYVPLAGITGQEAVGQQGQVRVLHCRHWLGCWQWGQGSFMARQFWTLAGLSLHGVHRVTGGQSSCSRLLHRRSSLEKYSEVKYEKIPDLM